MKIPTPSLRCREQGVAVVVVLAFLAILLLAISANLCSLRIMSQDLKQLEQRQVRRWTKQAVTARAPGETPAAPVQDSEKLPARD